jgi:threonine/homoserine/homoserine lactone efflux protein
MERTLLEILPLALAAALSPTGLLFVTAIIGGKGNARRNALLFVVGGIIFLAVLGLVIMLVFNHTVVPSDHHKKLSAWIDIIFGALIILVVWSSLFIKRKKKATKVKKRQRPYVIVGFFFMMINTSTNIPFAAASKTIADSGLPPPENAVLFIVLVLITISMFAFPVVFSYVAPEKSEVVLGKARTFMQRYGAQLTRAFFIVVGIYLVVKGIHGLNL